MNDRWQDLAKISKKPTTLVVNLYGGPGTGKSTTAAGIFYYLKSMDFTAELVSEFAKDLVWEQRHRTLEDQVYVFGKQQHRLTRLLGEVDVVITDSPIMLTPVYSRGHAALNDLAYDLHKKMKTLDIFLARDNSAHPYNERGRYQDLAGAEKVDRAIRLALAEYDIQPEEVTVGTEAVGTIVTWIVGKLYVEAL